MRISVSTVHKYKKIYDDPDFAMEINTLIHEKENLGKQGTRIDTLDKAIKLFGEKPNKKLYRGVSSKELGRLFTKGSAGYYQSFSETYSEASAFGEYVITLLPSNAKLFSLHDYTIADLEHLKKTDPAEYSSIDGDFLKRTALAEKEWISPFNMQLKVVDPENFVFQAK